MWKGGNEMRSKQKNISAKAYKILSLVLAFTVLVSGLGVWYSFSGTSNTVEAVSTTMADSIPVNADFFDYYYDYEVNSSLSSSGNQGTWKNPYGVFNTAISGSDYAKAVGITTGEEILTSTFTVDISQWGDKPSDMVVRIWEENGAILEDAGYPMTSSDNGSIWSCTLDYALAKKVKESLEKGGTLKFQFKCSSINYYSATNTFPGNSTNYAYNINIKVNSNTWSISSSSQSDQKVSTISLPAMPLYFGQFWNSSMDYTSSSAQSQKAGDSCNVILKNFWWGANLAFRPANQTSGAYAQYNTVAQGLVDSSLTTDSSGTLVPTKNGEPLPYFSKTWIDNTRYSSGDISNPQINYDGSGDKIADYTEGIAFPFDKKTVNTTIANTDISGDYYVFNSAEDTVFVDKSTKKLTKGNYHVYDNDTSSQIGFFPFNSSNPSSKADLNYGFGARFDIPFDIAANGTVDGTADGDAVTFAFKGDDDVWVFLNNKLILDMGGAHKEAEGVIDFKNKTVTIKYVGNAQTNNIMGDESSLGIKTNVTKTFAELGISDDDLKTKDNMLTMYYMERGMINSNLYVQFNMAVIPNENTLTITDKVNATGVNSGLQAQTLAIADSDVVRYTIKNQGTTNDDITDSGILYPTTDFIRRYNQISSIYKPSVLLSGQKLQYDTEHIYLVPGEDYWGKDGAVIGAWLSSSSSGKSEKLALFDNNNITGQYRIDIEDYTKMILYRFDPKNVPTDMNTKPSSYWNYIGTISPVSIDINSNNCLTLTKRDSYDWGDCNSSGFGTWSRVEAYTSKTQTSIFEPDSISEDSDGFKKVSNTNFALSDGNNDLNGTLDSGLGLQIKDSEIWTDYIGSVAGQTSENGTFDLMYGQSATFTGQFKKGSTMKVLQSNDLYKPTIRSDDTVTEFELSGRSLSYYYNVSAPTLDNGNAVAADGTYLYQNADANSVSENEKVRLEETYVRSIKTGDLTIIKNVEKGDTSTAGTFTFQVTLNNLFGSDTSVSDYSEITYKLYENKESSSYTENKLSTNGTFTMGPNQKVVIEGIPVGTTYTVEETTVGSNYNKVGGVTYANTNKTITIDADDTVTVTNERKLGSLTLNKDVKDSNGTDNVTNDDKNTKFEFTVTLTAPTGVDLSKYDIVVLGDTVSSDKKTITVNVSENSPVTITGIPYGTGYTVTETNIPSDWTKLTETAPNGTISSDTQTATIVNKKNIVLTTDAYLTITKYIDSLYYNSSDNPHGFTNENYSIISGNDTTNDAHGYLKYTNAEQAFTFEVKEYDGDTLIGTYQVLLNFPADSTRLETAVNGSYYYVQSKTFKVTAGHRYEVTETNTDNGLSWRYDFALAEGSGNLTPTINGQTVSFTYAESAETAQEATATFYDKRNTTSNTIESDMSSITNNITKAAL